MPEETIIIFTLSKRLTPGLTGEQLPLIIKEEPICEPG